MAVLDIRRRTGYLFAAVAIAHIVLISAQVNTQRGVPLLEAAAFGLFAEVQRGTTSAIGDVREAWGNYFALQQVRLENEQLRRELGQLQIRLQQEQALAAQTRSLQELLDLRETLTLDTQAAALIGGGASPAFRTVTIDKGTGSGLKPDMAVISPSGVVGRVIMPSPRASKVQLLIDRDAAAGALVERSRTQGIVVGTGGDRLRMDYVPSAADVKVGDRVVTSGIDGIYPKGFVVGQIESIERSGGAFTEIAIRPAVDFSRLEQVLIVRTRPAADAQASE